MYVYVYVYIFIYVCVYVYVFQQSRTHNTKKINKINSNMAIHAAIFLLLIEPTFCFVVNRFHQNLIHVPADIDPAVTTLELNHNNIERIYVTSLDGFELLGILILHHNRIRFIEEGAFDNNPLVTELDLTANINRWYFLMVQLNTH